MKRPLLACLLALVMGLTGAAPAVAQKSVDGDRLDTAVSAVVDKHHLAGLALAVVDDDGVVLAEGYGSAGDDRPVTPDTPMVIGSVTKSFTAVAVLQLVEQGLVDLDASVRTYLPWFEVAEPAASDAITVRDLLAHTSGLSEFGYNRVLDPDTTLEEGVRDLRSARPTAPVGDTYQYFSPNYWTLALMIETLASQPYGDYVTEHIFQPLQMTRSYADPAHARAAGLAQGHSTLFGFAVPREQPFRRYYQGAGYLISTARDLSRFLLAIAHDGAYDGARILSPDSAKLMKTPLVGVNDSMGLGWGFVDDRWEASGGADETFNAQLMWSADLRRGFVWTMNQQHILGATFARQDLNGALTALLAGDEAPAGGMSMRTLGLVILGAFLLAVALTVRSLLRLRGWTRRSRGMTPFQIIRAIAPHVVVPTLILLAVYRLAGPLVFGVDWAFNFRYVGAYMLPDIALLLLVAIVPDLLQTTYMAGAVTVDRLRARGAPPEQPVEAPPRSLSTSSAASNVVQARSQIRARTAVSLFVLASLVTWLGRVPDALHSHGRIPVAVPFGYLAGVGPGVAALIVLRVRELRGRLPARPGLGGWLPQRTGASPSPISLACDQRPPPVDDAASGTSRRSIGSARRGLRSTSCSGASAGGIYTSSKAEREKCIDSGR